MNSPAPLVLTVDHEGNAHALAADGRGADDRALRISCNEAEHGLLSARELLLASLGSCLAASVTPLLQRHHASMEQVQISLQYGNDLASISVRLALPALDPALLPRLQRAAQNCPVYKALAIPVTMDWTTAT